MTSSVYASSVKSENTFGRIYSVLKNSGLENYIQTISSEEVLRVKIEDIVSDKISTKQEFYELTAYLFQSMTNIGYTTYEILEFICNTIFAHDVFTSDEQNEIIDFYKNSFCFVHTDYSKYPKLYTEQNKKVLDKILFGHDDKIDHFNMGLITNKNAAIIIGNSKGEFKKDLKVLSAFTGSKVKADKNKQNSAQYTALNKNFTRSSLNIKVNEPTKSTTSVSSILISNPDIRVGNQNSLELSSFFNGITTLEMNRSYPIMNAKFTLPTLSSQVNTGSEYEITATSSTINNFLFGDIDKSKKTQNYDSFSGNKIKEGVYESNMSLFTSPQTMVNLDENIGHSQNDLFSNRRTTVHDPTQPLMSIQSFSINSSPTKGLMSYKSGTLNLVLHDRTRMNDIAPFVKPDLLGSFGAEIILEYGWSNPDENNPKNPLGYFIGNSRVTEKYMIVNSSLSIDNNGQVNISLSIAMKGPHEFKNQQITSKVKNRVQESELSALSDDIDYLRSQIFSDAEGSFLDTYSLGKGARQQIFSETNRLTEGQIKSLEKFKNDFSEVYSKVSKNLSKHLEIMTYDKESIFNFSTTTLNEEVLVSFCKLITNETEESIKSKIKNANSSLTGSVNQSILISVNNTSKSKQKLMEYVQRILIKTNEVCNLIKEISFDDIIEGENENKILETIMGSVDYIDHFYPTSKKMSKIIGKNPGDFVSLGSIINTIVQNYLAKVKGKPFSQFDEIQTIFYTANEYAGAMANENIAHFLIRKDMLRDFLKRIFEKNTVITPESLISQIILNFVQVGDNITLGLSSLYESRKDSEGRFTKPLKLKNSDTSSASASNEAKKDLLRKIYGLDGSDIKNKEIKFKMPIVHMNFDCLTANGVSQKSPERSILRISIYDRSNSPFSATSEILSSIYQGNFNKVFGKFIKDRQDFKDNARGKKNKRSNLLRFNEKQKKEIERLVNSHYIIKQNDGTYKINNERVQGLKSLKGKLNIKDIYKQNYPSLTFGMQNSVMISANVTTMNDNKLATVFMTRPDRNDQSLINNRINQNMPLVIMPTQASVEIFGCPWVNFGQQIFLDFETGTTLDNRYVVTGITHNLSPGKFTTQLTLSFADNFGQAISFEESLEEKVSSKDKDRNRNKKSDSGSRNNIVKVTINSNYNIDGSNDFWQSNLSLSV